MPASEWRRFQFPVWSKSDPLCVSRRLICVNKIRPLKQHLDCWLLKQHLEKQHLDLLSTKGSSTTQTKPAHNLRMLWKWISWSTSSDFSGIWFSFQKNPLDWPLNQKIRKICTLEIKRIKSPIKPPGHHSSVVTSGWQMRPDWFQASLFLALIKTDKPSKTLTEFLSTFKYGAQISEAEKLAEIYIF